jgi:dihydrofolate reductase
MSKLAVSTFLTLDGVMQDPGGTGEFDRGGWQIQFFRRHCLRRHQGCRRPAARQKDLRVATVIEGDVPEAVAALKQEHDLLVSGSGQLVQTLRQNDLADEYEIWIHPIVLGAGKRLFEESADTTKLSLTDSKTTGGGIAVLTYQVMTS